MNYNIKICYADKTSLEDLLDRYVRKIGEQIVEEAEGVSYLWLFLGKLTISRADILQKQFDDAEKSMEDVVSMVYIFKSQELKMVIEHAFEVSLDMTYYFKIKYSVPNFYIKTNIFIPRSTSCKYSCFIVSNRKRFLFFAVFLHPFNINPFCRIYYRLLNDCHKNNKKWIGSSYHMIFGNRT